MIHIIGGAGFLGRRLAHLLENAARPFGIFDKSLTGTEYVDVTDKASLSRLPNANMLINLAAEHRDDVRPALLYDEVNVEGAKNICEHCREKGIEKIIFTSSVAVYGLTQEVASEKTIPHPTSDYGRTKLLAEGIYKEWLEEDPLRRSLVIIRPTVIFGEGNRGNVYNLLNSISSKRFIMFGAGENYKSMAYVENVAAFIVHSMSFGTGEHLYNYTDGPDLNMNELVAASRMHLFKKNNVGFRLPIWLGFFIGYAFDLFAMLTRKNLPVSSVRVKKFISNSRFETNVSQCGFQPPVSLEAGLERTLNHEFQILVKARSRSE